MSRSIKEKMVEEYGARFSDVSDVAVISDQGIDVKRMVAFRTVLRDRGIQAMRIHNRLGRRAMASGSLAGIDALLVGPTTLVWGGSGIVDIAKVLVGEARTLTEIEIRGGISGGEVLSKEQIKALSDLPSREVLIGWVVGNAIGQAARVVAAAMAVGGRLVAQICEVQEQTPADETPAEEQAKADEAEQQEAPSEETGTDDAAPAEEPKPDDRTETNGAQEPPAPQQAPPDQ